MRDVYNDTFTEKPKGCKYDLGETVICAVIFTGKIERAKQIVMNCAKGLEKPDDHEMFVFRGKVVGYSWGDSPFNKKKQDNPIYVLEVIETLFCNWYFYKRFKPKDVVTFNWSWVDILGSFIERKLPWVAPAESFVLS